MNKSLNEDVLIFLDLETTGLNPAHGMILEVGAVLVEQDSLEVIDTRSWVVKPMRRAREDRALFEVIQTVSEAQVRADDYVKKMHETNGLWAEVAVAEQTLIDVSREFPQWLHENGLTTSNQQFTIAGNGPDRFDRPWLRYYAIPLNNLDGLFHYRSLDISNVSHAFRKAGVDLSQGAIRPVSNHRGVDDCLQSLADWKFIRSQIGRLA